MIRILGRASSINVQKVMWLAAEVGTDVERSDIGGKFGGNDTPEYLAKNPNGLVPTMEDGDVVLWESHSIVRYIAEKSGDAEWYPTDMVTRSVANQWMDWYLTRLHPPMTTIFWTLIRTKPEDRDMDAFAAAAKQAGAMWRLLDDRLAVHPFVAGDAPTIGDIPVGCSVNRWFTLDVERPSLPRLEDFYERLKQRPPYARHVQSITME